MWFSASTLAHRSALPRMSCAKNSTLALARALRLSAVILAALGCATRYKKRALNWVCAISKPVHFCHMESQWLVDKFTNLPVELRYHIPSLNARVNRAHRQQLKKCYFLSCTWPRKSFPGKIYTQSRCVCYFTHFIPYSNICTAFLL